ncbi:MAG: GAF domain-containing protein [Streptosporangiaceae bacterium]
MSPDELLAELGQLANSLGPAVRPAGTEELLESLTETARRLFGAVACSLALLSDDESELLPPTRRSVPSAGRSPCTGTPRPTRSSAPRARTTICSVTARRAPGSSGALPPTRTCGPCACWAAG